MFLEGYLLLHYCNSLSQFDLRRDGTQWHSSYKCVYIANTCEFQLIPWKTESLKGYNNVNTSNVIPNVINDQGLCSLV